MVLQKRFERRAEMPDSHRLTIDNSGVVRTRMRAARNGFRFGNRFELALGWPGGRRVWRVAFGLCGGMSYAALDHMLAGVPMPDLAQPPAWGAPLHRYLLRRQWDSWRWLAVPLRTMYWMLLSRRQIARRTLERELPRILAALDKGMPQVLLLLRATGGDPTENHQVVVTGYQREADSDLVTLFLYDPNHPGREAELWVDITGTTSPWVYQSTGEPLRGFYRIGYRPRRPRLS
jgi:hypothetical protein